MTLCHGCRFSFKPLFPFSLLPIKNEILINVVISYFTHFIQTKKGGLFQDRPYSCESFFLKEG